MNVFIIWLIAGAVGLGIEWFMGWAGRKAMEHASRTTDRWWDK